MSFISFWAGKIEPFGSLSSHLHALYESIGRENFQDEPAVCQEREVVPIEELLEPFLRSKSLLEDAAEAARRQSLRLANTVVAIYTDRPPKQEAKLDLKCGLRFIGSYDFRAGQHEKLDDDLDP